jgi:hypothetical protein
MSFVICMSSLGTKDGGCETCYVAYHTSYYVYVGKYHNDQNIPQILIALLTITLMDLPRKILSFYNLTINRVT